MARELITDWSGYASSLIRVLALARNRIDIYDEDLARLNLESVALQQQLQNLLRNNMTHVTAFRLAVRNATPLRTQQPKLLGLLATYSHLATASETPAHLAHLRDSMLIVDDQHALIRFDKELPRSKLILGDIEEVRPYVRRFRDILDEGGEPITPTTLGL